MNTYSMLAKNKQMMKIEDRGTHRGACRAGSIGPAAEDIMTAAH